MRRSYLDPRAGPHVAAMEQAMEAFLARRWPRRPARVFIVANRAAIMRLPRGIASQQFIEFPQQKAPIGGWVALLLRGRHRPLLPLGSVQRPHSEGR